MHSQDIVFIEALEVMTCIGILDWEQHRPQRVIVDVELFLDTRKAAQENDLNASVNYAHVVDALVSWTQEKTQLLETLAERLAHRTLTKFNVKKVRIRVQKPDIIPACRSVGIEIVRELAD